MACMGSEEMATYDLDTKHGLQALQVFLRFVLGEQDIQENHLPARIREHPDQEGETRRFQKFLRENLSLVDLAKPFSKESSDRAEYGPGSSRAKASATALAAVTISRLFNRMLALTVEAQHQVFDFFEVIHDQILAEAKSQGTLDMGISDVYAESILSVRKHELIKLQGVPLTLYTLKLDRGIPFAKALAMRDEWLAKLQRLRMEEEGTATAARANGPVTVASTFKRGAGAMVGQTGSEASSSVPKDDVNDEVELDGFLYDGTGTGFYVLRSHPDMVILALELVTSAFSRHTFRPGTLGAQTQKRYKIISPNTGERGTGGFYYKEFTLHGRDLLEKYNKVKPARKLLEMVERRWTRFFELTMTQCLHHARGQKAGWRVGAEGNRYEVKGDHRCWCNPSNSMHFKSYGGTFCPVGRRVSTCYVLSGAVVPIWPAIQDVVIDRNNKDIQVVRCVTRGERLVGLSIKQGQEKELIESLKDFIHSVNPDGGDDHDLQQLAAAAEKEDHEANVPLGGPQESEGARSGGAGQGHEKGGGTGAIPSQAVAPGRNWNSDAFKNLSVVRGKLRKASEKETNSEIDGVGRHDGQHEMVAAKEAAVRRYRETKDIENGDAFQLRLRQMKAYGECDALRGTLRKSKPPDPSFGTVLDNKLWAYYMLSVQSHSLKSRKLAADKGTPGQHANTLPSATISSCPEKPLSDSLTGSNKRGTVAAVPGHSNFTGSDAETAALSCQTRQISEEGLRCPNHSPMESTAQAVCPLLDTASISRSSGNAQGHHSTQEHINDAVTTPDARNSDHSPSSTLPHTDMAPPSPSSLQATSAGLTRRWQRSITQYFAISNSKKPMARASMPEISEGVALRPSSASTVLIADPKCEIIDLT